jgi:hypothetical protein
MRICGTDPFTWDSENRLVVKVEIRSDTPQGSWRPVRELSVACACAVVAGR